MEQALFALEGVVRQLRVDRGERQVADGVLKPGVQILHALSVGHILAQHPEPLVAGRLRHDVLDGELRGGEVHRFRMLVALLQPL